MCLSGVIGGHESKSGNQDTGGLNKESAIPQFGYKSNPLNQGGPVPKIVDPTKPYLGWRGVSMELPESWMKWMNEYAVKGSGKIISPH